MEKFFNGIAKHPHLIVLVLALALTIIFHLPFWVYLAFVGAYAILMYFIHFPTSVGMTGYVMDALGAASKNMLTPAYYDVNLKGKVSRDEESTQSLDIIISTIKYDIGYLAGLGISSMLYSMADSYNTDLASQYQKQTKVVTKTLEKLVSKFEALDN